MAEDQARLHSEGKLDFDDDTLRAQVYLDEGNAEYRKNETSNAIYFYTEGIQVNCKDDILNAKLYSNRATAHFRLGNYQETLNDSTAAVELQPTFIKAIERGASACVQLKRYKEAMNWCEKGFAIDGNSKTLQDLWAKCFCEPNTSNEAEPQKMKRMPNTYNVKDQQGKKDMSHHGPLGNYHHSLGDFKTAIDYYERHLKVAKELGDSVEEGNTYCNLGFAYFDMGDFKPAIDYHERDLKIAKELGEKHREGRAYCNLGITYHRLGDIKTAIGYYERHFKIAKEVEDKVGEGLAYRNLGNAYYDMGNFKTAIDYHERDLKIAKELEEKAREGRGYCNLGIIYHRLGDIRTAIGYFESQIKIAKEVEDKVGEGLAYRYLGNTYSLEDINTAIDYHERQLKIAKEVGDKAEESRAYRSLGNDYCNLGDIKTAIDYHERALQIAKEVGDKLGEGASNSNLGNAYHSLGDNKTAIDFCERHLKIAREMGDKAGEGGAYCNLGIVYNKLGDFKTAIYHFEHSLKITKEVGDKLAEGKTYVNLGNAYQSLGDIQTAVECYKRRLEISKEVGDKAGEGLANGNLGNAFYWLGDMKAAIECHERHLKISKEVGNKEEEGGAYGNLGNAFYGLGDMKTAIEYYERHLKMSEENGYKAGESTAYCNLGNAYIMLGYTKTAIDYYELGLKRAKEVGDKAGVAKLLYCLGRGFESQGAPLRALECLRSSVTMFNDIRHQLQFKDEWKISFRDFNKEVYTSLWRLLLTRGETVEALFAAEQGRAQALNDLMELKYGFDAASSSSHTPDENLHDLITFIPSNTVFIAINEREIVFWVFQNGQVKLRRRESGNDSSLALNTFFQSLIVSASDEISLTGDVKCEDRSLVNSRDENAANERSPPTLHKPVLLHASALRTFYDIIIDPIADLVQGNELVLVPEGALCLAPYAVFVDPDSRFLCDSFRIRVIPSLTSLKLIADCPNGYHSKTGVLLVGDPWVQEVVYQGTKLEQLPCAREEVEMIGRILNTAPLVGREATKEEVLKRISSVALVHIAAHGRMDTGEIALTPNTTRTFQIPEKEDFLLTMRDVISVKIRARLVVLSCCHSARGEIKAEGVVGIARAFLAAGARSVLVSLWAIDDEATMEFMKYFYSHLMKGNSASESLNQAMKCMRESERFHEVKYWAPFVLIGDDVTLNFDGSD